MEHITKFNEFPRDKQLNENLFKYAWDKIWDFFSRKFGKGAWWPYAKFLDEKGAFLDKNGKPKIEIFDFGKTKTRVPSDKELKEEGILSEDLLIEGQIGLDHPNLSVRNVLPDELEEVILDAWDMKMEYPDDTDSIFIWGAPGIGKTDIVKQTAEKLGGKLIVWHLATIEPIDFVGLPGTIEVKGADNETHKRTTFYLPMIFPTDNGPNNEGGILFLDELNRANSLVLSAALQLCLDGKVGNYTVPNKWLILAAGNRRIEVPEATEIEPALSNRFAHVNLITTVELWQNWAIGREYMHPDVISYMSFDKQFFHYLLEDDNPPNWPSPRSWAKASKKYSLLRKKGRIGPRDYDKIRAIFADSVGTTPAANFVEYLKLREHFSEKDVAMVYTNPKKAKQPPDRIDISRGAMAAIAMHKKGDELSIKEMKNVLEYALSMENFETCTSLISFFKKVHPYIGKDPKYNKVYRDYIKKWHKDQFKKLSEVDVPSEEMREVLDDVKEAEADEKSKK